MLKTRDEQRVLSKGEGTISNPYVIEADANIQDQASDTVILPLVRVIGSTTLAALAVEEAYTVTLTSATDAVIGRHIRIFEAGTDFYYNGTILNVVGSVVTLDSQLDYPYSVGSQVTISSRNMNVDGSVTPVHFHLRTGVPSIPSRVDITRMIMVCTCTSAVDLNKFGNLPPLARGILFRTMNGRKRNIFNAKSNADLTGLAYDFTVYQASNPVAGIDGFSWRLTFGGQEKIGVVLRVEADGQLGMIVQDNLTGLTSLYCMVEGHVVLD